MTEKSRGSFPRKILVSPGYGTGWSTWAHPYPAQQFLAEYKPIIDFIEKGGRKLGIEFKQLLDELEQKMDEKGWFFSREGARHLIVATVYGPYQIKVYNGWELVKEESNDI